jgi:mannose-6-phosphate isomerase-like protein (cupin superfamily)
MSDERHHGQPPKYDPVMGQAGDVFTMPDGARYVLRTPTAETGGEYVEFEWIFPVGTFAPPPHRHPGQVEEYEVLEGELEVLVGDRWRMLRTGESASVPLGTNHTFGRPRQPVRVRNFHRPALGFESFIERTSKLFAAKNIRSLRNPRLSIYLAMMWREYPETLQETRARDRIAMTAATAVGRLLRMKPGQESALQAAGPSE